jgi:hypothetical protein
MGTELPFIYIALALIGRLDEPDKSSAFAGRRMPLSLANLKRCAVPWQARDSRARSPQRRLRAG